MVDADKGPESDFSVDWGGAQSETSASEIGDLEGLPLETEASRLVIASPRGLREDVSGPDPVVLCKAAAATATKYSLDHLVQPILQERLVVVRPPHTKGLRIAFCTSSLGRDDQVKAALPIQLLSLWPWSGTVRLYFADFNEGRDLQDWVVCECSEALESGLLRYGRSAARRSWHASVCKNMVHCWAAEWADVLVNLDGDRLLGSGFMPALLAEIAGVLPERHVCIHATNASSKGTYSTIAVDTRLFMHMHGYNEDFLPCGYEQTELLSRCAAAGAVCVRLASDDIVGRCLPPWVLGWRWSSARVANVSVADMRGHPAGLTVSQMTCVNREMAQEHSKRFGPVVRNCATSWRPEEVREVALEFQTMQAAKRHKSQLVPVVEAALAAAIRVAITTCGVRHVSKLQPAWKEARALRESSTVEQVAAVLETIGFGFDLALDLRNVHWGDAAILRAGHLGTHDAILAKVRSTPRIKDMFSQVMEIVNNSPPKATVRILCISTHGRSKCIAMAWCLHALLEGQVALSPPRHLSRHWLQNHMESCPECAFDRKSDVRLAIQDWLRSMRGLQAEAAKERPPGEEVDGGSHRTTAM